MYMKCIVCAVRKNIFYGLAGENVMKVGMRQLPCTNSAYLGNQHVRTCIYTLALTQSYMDVLDHYESVC